jgi:anti-sigma regulatory factor (Ser/Thr protein kinase)
VGTLLVQGRAEGAAAVRENIADDLRGRVAPDSVDDVLLVATELVSNAVRHGGADLLASGWPAFDVTWQLRRDHVMVGVEDPSPQLPRVMPPDNLRPSGRGMAIVSALAADWGVRSRRAGKQVWARIPVHRLV